MQPKIQIRIPDILSRETDTCAYDQDLLIVMLHGERKRREGEKTFLLSDVISFLFTLKGHAQIQVNEVECLLAENSIIDISNMDILQNMYMHPSYEGIHIIISVRFLEETLRNASKKENGIILNRMDNLYIELSVEETNILQKNIDDIIIQVGKNDHINQHELVKSYTKIFLLEFFDIAFKRRKNSLKKHLNREDLVIRFNHLINEDCCEHHDVRWYADKLCVDATYLSRIVKAVNGKTANQWIDEILVRKAKLYLSDEGTSIKEIADKLNFSDQAAFGKFFKKAEGLSPLNYRRVQLIKKLEKEQEM